MDIIKKVAYVRGLADGLKIDESKDEAKILLAMLDILDELAEEVSYINDDMEELDEKIDEIDEDLYNLENDFYDEDGCDCDCDCDDECDYDEDEENDVFYEVTCPTCNETICLSEDVLLKGEMDCPNCGNSLEFDFDEDCDCSNGAECTCGDECNC